ncbi:hypothetical protein L873DRAFT_1042568 [Choiromyces venosus 120613-1]|uniref:DAGKc domain-containing protein n=1 Tax=Choiromyces venosus 120613-1 TaxID=1336337 RepID=A0A3N4JQJ4_9PEZI|nr:hypothetical protein L873DRAFT_1042568 [Choiromyces venosus 120613-1]
MRLHGSCLSQPLPRNYTTMEPPQDTTPAPAYISTSKCDETLTFLQDSAKAVSIPLSYLLALVPTSTVDTYTLIFHTGTGGVSSSSITAPPAELIERYAIPATTPAHLRGPVSVITSPHSGLGLAEAYSTTLLLPILNFYAVDYEKHAVTDPNAIKSIAQDAIPAGKSTIILLSGDTLISELLNELPGGKRPTIIPIPTGTGNGLASSLYNPSSSLDTLIANSLRALLHGSVRPLPGFTVTFSPGALLLDRPIPAQTLKGIVVTSWAFHASLVADANTPQILSSSSGTEKFKLAAQQNLSPPLHAYRGTISILRPGRADWEEITDTDGQGHFYLVVTGVSNFEPAFRISPAAENGADGILRIVYFGVGDVRGAEGVMEVMEAVYDSGRHVSMPGVRYEEVDAVRIHVKEEEERWRRICVDGAVVTLEKEGWVEVRRHEGWADVVCESRVG